MNQENLYSEIGDCPLQTASQTGKRKKELCMVSPEFGRYD